jgi:glyceraldehyde 3-phosphate dehydrogenase
MNSNYEQELVFQTDRRRATVEFIKIISDLWYDHNIELIFFRNQLIDKNVSEIMQLHQYAGDFVQKPIAIFDTLIIAKAIENIKMPPAKIDIGKLTYEHHLEIDQYDNTEAFLTAKFSNIEQVESISPKDVVLYGFGRIGRLLARELMTRTGKGKQLRLRAIVTRGTIDKVVLEKRASLLQTDSVHGYFPGTVRVDEANSALIINGTTVHMISASKPEEIDYESYDIYNALIIDNTGAFRDKEALSHHLLAKGVSKVLLTAPGKGIPNIVYGVNHKEHNPKQVDIFSAASCTTNAITPILKVINDTFGIKRGHLETIHAYTNDQNLVDNMHNKYRRGRAAALNMVITETGAGKAVAKALPEMENKLTSNAIRVPVPNGSLAILNLELERNTSKDAMNIAMKKYALEGDLVEQIKYELNNELVSSDIVGSAQPAIYDSNATIVDDDGKNVVVYIWYDNEYGYSHQVIRLAKYVAQVRRYTYY